MRVAPGRSRVVYRRFLFTVSLFVVFLGSLLGQEISLQERLEWLDTHNGGDREYSLQLRRTLSDLTNVLQRADTAMKYLDRIPDREERSSLALEAGRIYALVLDFGRAEGALERAVEEDSYNQKARLLYAEVLQEVGNPKSSIEILLSAIRRADSVEKQRRAAILLLRAYLLAEDQNNAVEFARSLVEGTDATYIGAATFFLVREVAARYDEPELYDSATTILEENFPDSLEQNLVESTVLYLPVPSRLLSGFESFAPTERNESPATPVLDDRMVLGIQTGSFRDSENSEYMARDLTSLGFTAEILETPEGYFKVFVPTEEQESVQEVVVRLKEHGYEGFLLFSDE